MKARIFRYLAAACNGVMFILAFALPYLGGYNMFTATGVELILNPEAQSHFGILSLGLWGMIILTVACAAMWAIHMVPRWVVMLVQAVQLVLALVVSLFLLWFANNLDNSFSGIIYDLATALFGGESVLASYVNPNFYVHLLLSLVALLLGAFAEQPRYYYYDDEPIAMATAASAPAQKEMGLIECEGGHFRGEVFPIEADVPLAFGRDPDECDIVFPADNLHVSRKHCVITLKPVGHIYEVLCTSANGMLVGGEVCAGEQKKTVKRGTTISIGDKENVFVLN